MIGIWWETCLWSNCGDISTNKVNLVVNDPGLLIAATIAIAIAIARLPSSAIIHSDCLDTGAPTASPHFQLLWRRCSSFSRTKTLSYLRPTSPAIFLSLTTLASTTSLAFSSTTCFIFSPTTTMATFAILLLSHSVATSEIYIRKFPTMMMTMPNDGNGDKGLGELPPVCDYSCTPGGGCSVTYVGPARWLFMWIIIIQRRTNPGLLLPRFIWRFLRW